MSDITNITQLLQQNKEVLIIDMLDHVLSIDEDPYIKAFVQPDSGIYLTGSIDPVLRSDRKYYKRSDYGKPDTELTDLSEIFKINDDLVDSTNKVIFTHKVLKTMAKYIRTEPSVPAVAIKVAIGVVLKYLNSLCSHTHVNSISYNIDRFIKPEYQYLVHREEYSVVFENLLDQVMEFVGKDHWYIYFYKVKGTNLIIEKTIDWRIYRYYELEFEKKEASLYED